MVVVVYFKKKNNATFYCTWILIMCDHRVVDRIPEPFVYRKFPNRGAGRLGKTLGGAIIRESSTNRQMMGALEQSSLT